MLARTLPLGILVLATTCALLPAADSRADAWDALWLRDDQRGARALADGEAVAGRSVDTHAVLALGGEIDEANEQHPDESQPCACTPQGPKQQEEGYGDDRDVDDLVDLLVDQVANAHKAGILGVHLQPPVGLLRVQQVDPVNGAEQ